jgi:hypothetical protein
MSNSMTSICAPSGASRKQTRRPSVGASSLEDAHAIGPKPGQRARIVVGVDSDVLDTVVLLAALSVDERGDVQRQPVQVHAVATRADLGDQRRAKVVHVELHRALGVPGLQVHVVDAKGHARSPFLSRRLGL